MSQPTREEVQAYIDALKYDMKVSHKPEFLIALAEGWLKSNKPQGVFLQTIYLKPGDIVKIAGAMEDLTVSSTDQKEGRCVRVNWTNGTSTTYRYDKTHTVFR